MKKRFFKIFSIFLIAFSFTNFFQQREEYANAEVVSLSVGSFVVVKNILVAVGVVGSTSEVTYSLAQSYMNWLDENNTEQAQKIRAMTPVSCDTPGCIEEEQLKEAYKYKAKLQSGEITLPSVKALQTFNELGTNTIVNTSSYDFDYVNNNRIDYKNTYNINTVIRLKKSGTYKLTFNLVGNQAYWTSMTKIFYFQALENYSIQFYSCTFTDYPNAPYALAVSFMDSNNNFKEFSYSGRELTSLPGGFIGEKEVPALQTSTFQDSFTYNLECIDGLGMATSENTVEKEISPDDITYPDSTIPVADSGSICINVPDSIANSWDSVATPDVIDSDTSALQNANGDTWDYDKGWIDLGLNGLLKDIINAIKGIGKDVFDNFEKTLNSIANGISDLIDSVNGIAKNICDSLGLTELFDNVISAINSISFDDIINAIKSLTWADVVNAIISLPSAIWQFFDSILNDILQAIKDLITLLKQLLIELFVPSDTYFRQHFDDLREQLKPYMSVDDFNNIFNKEYSSGDVQDYYFYFMGSKICIPLSLYNNIKSTVLPWIRGIMYFLLVLFNLKSIYSIVRGGSLMKDLNTIDNAVNGKVGGVD